MEEIDIHGVLVCHSSMHCVPMKNNVQVNKCTSFMKRDELIRFSTVC